MKRRIVLLGGGGHASDVLAAIEGSGSALDVVVADDGCPTAKRFEGRARVLDGPLEHTFHLDALFLSAIGYPRARAAVVSRADAAGVAWAKPIVHRQACVHPTVGLELDSVVLGQTWISANVVVGAHSNVAYGVTIGHDARLGEFTSVMPGASIGGDTSIGNRVLIGASATILQGVKIADGVTIGAGAVVTKDVSAEATVAGVPAKPMERHA